MKTNPEGRNLIALFQDEYESCESRTAAEKAIHLYVNWKLNSNQFSALVSLVISIGIEDFQKKFLHLVNSSQENPAALSQLLDLWRIEIYEFNEQDDRVLDPFLMSQRECEIALYLKPEIPRKRKGT